MCTAILYMIRHIIQYIMLVDLNKHILLSLLKYTHIHEPVRAGSYSKWKKKEKQNKNGKQNVIRE